MQQWEYLFVQGDLAGGDRLRVRWVNGVEISNWKQGGILYEYVQDLGKQGWELVTTDTLSTRAPHLIFKRPT